MRAKRGVILSTDGVSEGSWPLRPLRRELAPVANTALIALELQRLHDAGIPEVGIVGDEGLMTAARQAIGEAGIDIGLVHIPPPSEPGLARQLLAAEPFIGNRPFVAEIAGSLTQHDLDRSVELLVRKRLGAVVVLAESGRRVVQPIPLRGAESPMAAEVPRGDAFLGANVFVFASEVFDAARTAIELQHREQVDLTDVLEVLAEDPGHVQAMLPTSWSKRLQGIEDLLEINRLALEAISPAQVPEVSAGNRMMGPVVLDETALVESSVLSGPLVIAAGAYITDSYVGPYTAIGARARVDGSEIERSVVLPAASISSVGTRIEGSVIGASARITRELAPPRALQLWVGEDALVSLA